LQLVINTVTTYPFTTYPFITNIKANTKANMDPNNISKTESMQSFGSEDDVNHNNSPEAVSGLSRAKSGQAASIKSYHSYISFSSMDVYPPPDPELGEAVDVDGLTEPTKGAIEIVAHPKWRKAFSFMRIFDAAK
jgi:hypothetical protein